LEGRIIWPKFGQISGQPEYSARNEISGPKIHPGYWVTPRLVLSRFLRTLEGADYPPPGKNIWPHVWVTPS
jgi:hypothetical protein